MSVGFGVIPSAWMDPGGGGGGESARCRSHSCHSSFSKTSTMSPTLASTAVSRTRSHREASETLQHVLDELETDLEELAKKVCNDMQQTFSMEVRSRLKTLARELEHDTPHEGSQSADSDVSHSPMTNPMVEKIARTGQKRRKPIELSKSDLQAATMEHDMRQGRADAQKAVLAAGFLGGSGRKMQAVWFGWGLLLLVQTLTTDDSVQWNIGTCGPTCRLLRFSVKLRAFFLGTTAVIRSYLLHRGYDASAHWALLIGACGWVLSGLALNVPTFYLTWHMACDWRDEAFMYHEAGSSCYALSHIDSMFSLIILAPLTGMIRALWRMCLKDASYLFICTAALYFLQQSFYLISSIYFVGHGDNRSGNILTFSINLILSVSVMAMVQIRRHSSKRRAWKVVEKDAEAYQDVWADVVANHSESVQALAEAARQAAAAIKFAAGEGPQRQLSEAENLRRRLLQYHRSTPGGLQQSLSSLPLLFAQACAVDAHFQRKSAAWAAGVGNHIAGLIKQPSRAIQKIWRSYNGKPQSLVDLVRSSIVCETPGDVLTIFRNIQCRPRGR
eukprot:TRINITY_DN21884_c0_g1_i2.p1 TRINITY_DN21884_c0_g1~~TRINITY_DN21884_c0_g1_i2.p1  ORF type:complete len:559 (+),score=65.68 TRINITY_DN21884_c0_g1_i2:176-1852(+)